MGDISDMVLEGLLDEETGEYQGDINKDLYGEESPGFPISHTRNAIDAKEARERNKEKINCPYSNCNKRVKANGLRDHIRDVHGE